MGTASCRECHEEVVDRWTGSDHERSGGPATSQFVAGDFSARARRDPGVTAKFRRDGERYFIAIEDIEYEVAYAVGRNPLQFYAVRFGDGRYQVPHLAWDSRPRDDGGQRWRAIEPHDGAFAGTSGLWTDRRASWNSACGRCHGTAFDTAYDAGNDRYESTWQALDVGCEACHGPAGQHLAWALSGAPAGATAKGFPVPAADLGNAACAACHGLGTPLTRSRHPARNLLDHYLPARLAAGAFHADGAPKDRALTMGAFSQSLHDAANVGCVDCHDPHATSLRADGDGACTTCHGANLFGTAAHTRHTASVACADCHMPPRAAMTVDTRHDHRAAVPHPSVADSVGAPDACTACHADKEAAWAVGKMAESGVEPAPESAARAIALGRARAPDGAPALAELILSGEPPIRRATALDLLRGYLPSDDTRPAIAAAAGDPDPLVRVTALGALETWPLAERLPLAFPLLLDPLRAIRAEAARVLAALPRQLPDDLAVPFGRGMATYFRIESLAADDPAAWVRAGVAYGLRGVTVKAEQHYRMALRLDDSYVPAYLNLADVLRVSRLWTEALRTVDRGLTRLPDNARLHHARGLILADLGRLDEAMDALIAAARLAPDDVPIAYAYAGALHDSGHADAAITVLEDAALADPDNADVLFALARLQRDAGNLRAARAYVDRLLDLDPDHPRYRALFFEIERLRRE